MSAGWRRNAEGKRSGTAKKKKSGLLLPILFAAAMLGNAVNLSNLATQRLVERLGEPGLAAGAGLLLALLSVTVVVLNVGTALRDLNKLESDVEWLLSLPASVPVLHAMKIAERATLNYAAWFTVFPFLTVLAWHADLRWSAPFVAAMLCLPLFLVLAIAQVVLEAAARSTFPAFMVRNAQGVAIVVGLCGMFLVISPAFRVEPDYFMWNWLRAAGRTSWFPLSQAAIIAATVDPFAGETWARVGAYLLEAVGAFGVCWWALHAVHRKGVVAGRGVLQGSRGTKLGVQHRPGFVRGIAGKDLRLLARDRTFLASTLVVPVAVVAMQVGLAPQAFSSFTQDPVRLALTAFSFGAYLLLVTAPNVLNTEAPALWLLYTLPQRLEGMLLRKALMWAPFACIYTGAMLVYGFTTLGFSRELLIGALYALAGLPLYALIGGALGIFAVDPTVQEARRRVRVDYVYLFMVLQGLYAYGFYGPTHWSKLVLLVLLAALALALWQNVGKQIPFLLDPVSKPPPTISLSDGLIAALFFFVVQGALFVLFVGPFHLPQWPSIVASFAGAGFLVTLVSLGFLWRRKVASLCRTIGLSFGNGLLPVSREGLRWALPAVLVAVSYQYLATKWLWLADQVACKGPTLFRLATRDVYWVVGLAVIAAPVFEEIIFRGLVFRGLRSSLRLALAVPVSAAVFAIVHPAVSLVPVFLMAVCAAVAFERSASLLAPMFVHASYNAAVVAFALTATSSGARTCSICDDKTKALAPADNVIGTFDSERLSPFYHYSEHGTVSFTVDKPGAHGTKAAARATGTKQSQSGTFHAPYVCTDVSAFNGVTLWAKSSTRTALQVQFGTPQLLPPEFGGDCTEECWGFHEVTLELSDEWRFFAVPFEATKRPWGSPVLRGNVIMRVDLSMRGSDFDVWVDEIAFYRGNPPQGAELPN
jgi:hypothetical protein